MCVFDCFFDIFNMKIISICVTSLHQNCLLCICQSTSKAIIVDPGGDLKKIKHIIDKEKIFLEFIVLTHGHLDHCGAALEVAKEFNVLIYGPHQFDEFLFKNFELQSRILHLPCTKYFVPHVWLTEGLKIKFGKQILEILHCPGHTPGHIALFSCLQSLIIVGDILFLGSIGRTDLPGGNKKILLQSIMNKILPLGDHVTVYPGHGRITTIGHERKHNPFLMINDLYS